MSGIEVIGLLASAAQLAFYTINISDLVSEIYHRVQNAPKRIQEHIQQIGQLISTARLIEKHELLQTDNINAHIISTLHQAKLLSATLDKVKGEYLQRSPLRRYWKLIKGGTEREILANFERLEKEKSSLLLCISIVHTDLLGNIRGNLDLSTDRSSVSMPSDKKASVCLIWQTIRYSFAYPVY